jgi:hypothetical protein
MKLSALLFILSFLMLQCSENNDAEPKTSDCSTPATMRDLTGLDGCGFVFELEDGTRLQPVIVFRCGTPPIPENEPVDPMANIQWSDGKKVMIDYKPATDMNSVCMAGELVWITCVSEFKAVVQDR